MIGLVQVKYHIYVYIRESGITEEAATEVTWGNGDSGTCVGKCRKCMRHENGGDVWCKGWCR